MKPHKHAQLYKRLAELAQETETPNENFEFFSESLGKWIQCNFNVPVFKPECEYREIKKKKVIDLSRLIDSRIDCEFFMNDPYTVHFRGPLASIGHEEYIDDSNAGWPRCSPRMNHWHAWNGGECPLPEGFYFSVKLRNANIVHDYSGGCLWTHDRSKSDIIGFNPTGIQDSHIMPWEVKE